MSKKPFEYEWLALSASLVLEYSSLLKPLEFKLLMVVAALGDAAALQEGLDAKLGGSGRSLLLRTTRRRLRHWLGPVSKATVGRALHSLQEKGLATCSNRVGRGLEVELHLSDQPFVRGMLGSVVLDLALLAFGSSFPSSLVNYSRAQLELWEGPAAKQVRVSPGTPTHVKHLAPAVQGLTALLSDSGFLRAGARVLDALEPLGEEREKREALRDLNRFLLEKGRFTVRNWPRFMKAWVRRRKANVHPRDARGVLGGEEKRCRGTRRPATPRAEVRQGV